MRRRKILLMADVRNWAFHQNLADMARYLDEDHDFSLAFVEDLQREGKQAIDLGDHDHVYVPYMRWREALTLDLSRVFGSLRCEWFTPETPGPPTIDDVVRVNSCRAFHVVTRKNYDELAPQCPRLHYLTNPVDMDRFPSPTQVDKVVVAWAGNARHINAAGLDVKGFQKLVRPAARRARVPVVEAEYHTSRRHPREMPAFYHQASVAVYPSLYEGASSGLMEAMASGLAIIATDVGNHRELQESQIEHLGDTGIFLVERDVDAIAAELARLKEDPARLRTMGRLNRAEIRARWSWHVWAERYREYFRT